MSYFMQPQAFGQPMLVYCPVLQPDGNFVLVPVVMSPPQSPLPVHTHGKCV